MAITAQFLNKLYIVDTETENEDYRALWQLTQDFGYRDHTGWEIWVPAGYITDFGSIPRLLWRIEPPTGRARRATVIHDWLYASRIVPKPKADRIFSEAMEICGVPYLKRQAMYAAVRAFGGRGYQRDEDFEQARKLLQAKEQMESGYVFV